MSIEDVMQEALTEKIHGSGWDGKWEVRETTKKGFVCEIGYHAMNEYGFYDGWFVIRIHINKALDSFTMRFTASPYHRRKYITSFRDMFFEQFNFRFDEIVECFRRKHFDSIKGF